MPGNIFDQVQRSITDPQGGGIVSGFTPTPASVSPLATAIKGIGDVVKTGREVQARKDVKSLQGDLQTGIKDFVAAEEAEHVVGLAQQTAQLEEQTAEFFTSDEASPVEEVALLTDMRSRLKKWDQAFKQKRISATEFKIKMDSTLKKYINMNPSIASELRKAASSTLGFDPTGAELNAIFAQQRSASKTSSQMQKATIDLIKKFGLGNPQLDDTTNISLFGQKAFALQNTAASVDYQYNAANKMNSLTKSLQIKLANQSSGSDIVNARGGINTILDSDLGGVDKQRSIQDLFAKVQIDYRARYPNMSPSDLDSVLKPLSDVVEQSIDVASGKLTKELYDNIYQGNTNSVLAGFSGTPTGARYLATIKMAKNLISLPSSVGIVLGEGIKDLAGIEKLQVSSLGTNGRVSPFSGFDDLPSGGNASMSKWFKKSAEAIANNADPKDPSHVNQFQNIIEGIMVPMFSDPERVQAIEYDTMLKMAGNPKFVDMLKAMPDADRVRSKLARTSTAYTTALLQKFGNEVFDNYSPSRSSGFSLREAVFGVEKDKIVQVDMDSTTGALSFSARPEVNGERRAVAESAAQEFTQKYASRFNDSVRLAAHLRGHTNYKGMLDQFMERAPELLFFLKDAKETDPKQVP